MILRKLHRQLRLNNKNGTLLKPGVNSAALYGFRSSYTFYKYFHEYLIQHSLKSGGTKDHFRQVKVPDAAPY
jgi:hypothetical protein